MQLLPPPLPTVPALPTATPHPYKKHPPSLCSGSASPSPSLTRLQEIQAPSPAQPFTSKPRAHPSPQTKAPLLLAYRKLPNQIPLPSPNREPPLPISLSSAQPSLLSLFIHKPSTPQPTTIFLSHVTTKPLFQPLLLSQPKSPLSKPPAQPSSPLHSSLQHSLPLSPHLISLPHSLTYCYSTGIYHFGNHLVKVKCGKNL